MKSHRFVNAASSASFMAALALGCAGAGQAGVVITPSTPLAAPDYTTGTLPLSGSGYTGILSSQAGGTSFSYAAGGLTVAGTGGEDPSLSLTLDAQTPVCAGGATSCVNTFGATLTYQVVVTGPAAQNGVPLDAVGTLGVADGYVGGATAGGYHRSTAQITLTDAANTISYTMVGNDYFTVSASGAVPPTTTFGPPPSFPAPPIVVASSPGLFYVQPGDTIDVTLQVIGNIYNIHDYSSASVDPTFKIDPAFASVDPNYAADYSISQSSFASGVPEPGAWLLMATGAALAGAALRRSARDARRRQAARGRILEWFF